MKPLAFRIATTVLALVALASPASSATTDKAVQALRSGDYKAALAELRPLAAKNDPQAQFCLGWMYAEGSGVKEDHTEAIRWLSKSAAQRNTRAMGMLATELFTRSLEAQDLVDAYAWSHLAAEMDPGQARTATRLVIEKHCSDDQKAQGQALMADWKRKWASSALATSTAP